MRLFQFHTNADAPADGAMWQPTQSTVGIQAQVEGSGTVTAEVQVKGRMTPDMEWEDIGSPISLSGTDVATDSVTLTNLTAAEIICSLGAVSGISFNCWGSEARG